MQKTSPTFDRAQSPVRWFVLVLACLSMFGSYYCYDNPSVLNDQFEAYYSISGVEFNLLYTVYSVPNVILPFFGGYFVDKLGTKVTLFTFLMFIVLGQLVFALSASITNFPLALVGRVIFGLGGESLSVGQSTLLALWFRGKEMAFAMGVNLSVSRLGSVVNNNVTPAAYNRWGLPVALWIGFFICLASLASTITLIFVERCAEARVKTVEAKGDIQNDDKQPLLEATDNLDETAPISPPPEPAPAEEIRFSDVKEFPLSFWLITLSCVVVYSSILPFNSNASSFLESTKYGYSEDASGRIQSVPFLISAIASPFLGGIVDKLGHRAILCTCSAVGLFTAHVIMAFSSVTPVLPFAILGASYSVYAAALWPSVAFVVQSHQLGTAYGVVTAVQNGGLALVPVIVGAITTSHEYVYREIFFFSIAACGIVVGIFLMIVDFRNGGILNLPSAEADKVSRAKYAASKPLVNSTSDAQVINYGTDGNA